MGKETNNLHELDKAALYPMSLQAGAGANGNRSLPSVQGERLQSLRAVQKRAVEESLSPSNTAGT